MATLVHVFGPDRELIEETEKSLVQDCGKATPVEYYAELSAGASMRFTGRHTSSNGRTGEPFT
jgi:hypothetical protein